MGRFVIKKTSTGFRFALKAGNGETVAASEVYATEAACRRGIASVRKNAPGAAVEDQTLESCRKLPHPKFEIYQDRAEEFRFRLKAANGQVIAVSDGYRAKSGCLSGIESVKKNAPEAAVEEI